MMDGDTVWEPSNTKEASYYDKLFDVADRDKNGSLDGPEAVKFLALSGLSKIHLKVPVSYTVILSIGRIARHENSYRRRVQPCANPIRYSRSCPSRYRPYVVE